MIHNISQHSEALCPTEKCNKNEQQCCGVLAVSFANYMRKSQMCVCVCVWKSCCDLVSPPQQVFITSSPKKNSIDLQP